MYRDLIEYFISNKEIKNKQFIVDIFNDEEINKVALTRELNIPKKDERNLLIEVISNKFNVKFKNNCNQYTDPLGFLGEYDNGFCIYSPIQGVVHSLLKREIVTITYNRTVLNFIVKLKELFTTNDILNILNLEKVYSYRLYLYVMKFLSLNNTSELEISIDQLRNILGTENKYEDFRDFNRHILKKSINDISKNIGTNISYSKITNEQNNVTNIVIQVISSI